MKSSHRSQPKILHLTSTNTATTSPPAGLTAPGMPSMLNNAHNTHIENGSFNITTNFNTVNGPSLHELHKRVAPNAILNAGGRADEPKCHPGTREEVINHIENWHDAEDGSTAPLFWLSGPAGAGKSAIVQTISMRCDERQVPHANFFFFRTDSSRSQVSPLIATLIYQIISVYPSLRDHIATLLFNDPVILDSSLKDQLTQLIVAPLRTIQQSTPDYRPILFLIDGLDECDSDTKHGQHQILHAFDAIFGEHPTACPFRLLVASRNESQIQLAFNKLSSPCMHLYLDDTYSPENDIRKFVDAEFKQIRETHPLRHTLDAHWPPSEDIDYIVGKSSGQFIYAATVMRFMSQSSAVPTISLERIKGAVQLATKSPFSHLDAIYMYILLQVDDQEALKDILNAQLLINHLSDGDWLPEKLLEVYNQKYTGPMIISCLADLTPIAQYARGKLKFYHASFPDFLLDPLRSGDHFVDVAAFNYKFLPVFCKHFDSFPQLEDYSTFVKRAIVKLKTLPPGLLQTLASSKSFIKTLSFQTDKIFFQKTYKLCISDDDIANFKYLVRHGARNFSFREDHQLHHYRVFFRPAYALTEQQHQDADHCKSCLWHRSFRGAGNDIPFGQRYLRMAYVENQICTPSDRITAALDLRTDAEDCESALWLKDLLYRIHEEKYHHNIKEYRELLRAWSFWAVKNDIPLDGSHDKTTSNGIRQSVDIPYSRRCFAMARVDCNPVTPPKSNILVDLEPETDADRHEIALWLKGLLENIHKQLYHTDLKGYRKLLKMWISWALRSDIPCDVLEGLPNAQWYILANTPKKWLRNARR